MNRFSRFIGILVAFLFISFGTVLLSNNLGLLTVDPFMLTADFWPVLLIIIGFYFIWLRLRPAKKPKSVTISEGLNGTARANVTINFGAGELMISPLKRSEKLLEGEFLSKPEKQISKTGDLAEVKLSHGQWLPVPFVRWFEDQWKLGLSNKVPMAINLNSGASKVYADLLDNKVESIDLNTGASDVVMQLPKAAGFTKVMVKGGAASIKLSVPKGVAARIRSTGALSSLSVDESRFPSSKGWFMSPDFNSAKNRVDIEISTGVSNVTIA